MEFGRVPKRTKGTDCKSVIRRSELTLGLLRSLTAIEREKSGAGEQWKDQNTTAGFNRTGTSRGLLIHCSPARFHFRAADHHHVPVGGSPSG